MALTSLRCSCPLRNGEDVRFPIPVRVESSALEMLADIPPEISLGDAKEVQVTVANNRPSAVSGVCVSVHADEGLELTPERIFVGNIEPFEQRMKTSDSAGCRKDEEES